MGSRELEALRRYRDELQRLADLGVAGAEERVHIYSELARIAEASPLQAIAELPSDGIEGNTPLRDLLAYSSEAFNRSGTPDLLADRLSAFGNAPTKGFETLPEHVIMKGAAANWLSALRGEQEDAFLLVSLSVSLNPMVIEEDIHSGRDSCSLSLPVSIDNRGGLGVSFALLYLRSTTETVGVSIDGAEWLKDKRCWRLRSTEIAGHSGQRFVINIKYTQSCAIDIWAESNWSGAASPSERTIYSNHLEVVLDTPIATAPVDNPYVAGLPLVADLQWDRLVQGRHPNLVAELCAEVWRSPNVIALRGCRRSGKTTMLKRISKLLGRGDTYIPIYFDVRDWWASKSDSSNVLGPDDICFELASHALREVATSAMAESAEIQDEISRVAEILNSRPAFDLSTDQLEYVLGLLAKATRKSFCILMDEVDLPVIHSSLKGNVVSLLDSLEEVANSSINVRILIAHDWSSQGWEARLGQRGVRLFQRRVPFLNLPDLQRLATISPDVRFTDLAVDFIWRSSGGWPGLSQLLFQKAVDLVISLGAGNPIDVKTVKSVAETILVTEAEDIEYTFGSIASDEWSVIKGLIASTKNSSGDGFSMGITPGDKTAQSLAEKEIIQLDKRYNTCRLRVGLLARAAMVRGVR